MGTKHRFLALKNFATKEVKFNQEKHLEVVIKQNPTNSDYTAVQRGVCATAAMQYIVDFYKETTLFVRGTGQTTANITAHNDLVKKFAPIHKAFSQSFYTGELMAIWDMAEALDKAIYPDSDPIDLTDKLLIGEYDKVKVGGNWINFAADIKDWGTGAHAVAICRASDGSCKFFDPNVGAYHIQAGNFNNFFTAYLDAYNNTLEWKIKSAQMFFINYKK